jgi:hypothetical protein
LPNSSIFVCGVLTLSTGKQRYFLAIGNNNSLVVDEDDLDAVVQIIKPLNPPDEATQTQYSKHPLMSWIELRSTAYSL